MERTMEQGNKGVEQWIIRQWEWSRDLSCTTNTPPQIRRHSDLCHQVPMPSCRKWLGEQVGTVILAWNVVCRDLPRSDLFPDEMMPDIDVLCSTVRIFVVRE